MFREYQDVRIKRNLKYVKRLSLVALILCALCTYTYLFWKWYLYEGMISHPQNLSLPYICNFWGGEKFWRDTLDPYKTADLAEEIIWDFIYCLGYFELAIFTYFFSKNFAQKPFVWRRKLQSQARFASNDEMKESYKESSQNNDITRIKLYIIVNFIPVAVFVVMIFACLIALMAGTYGTISDGVRSVSYHLGGMLLSHLFVIISSGFLIQNCVLIKREWKTNPPPFLLEKQQQAAEERQKAEEEAQKQKQERDTATCKALLEECGMQFFIEYYPQINRLPIPDINVSDHYFPERQVRLSAAKKIVDSGLTECALHYITETFGDVFSSEIIEQAKTILNEIENKKGEPNENN